MTRPAASGQLARNLMIFVRLLRAAGLRAGSDKALIAIEALTLIGLSRRDDVHAALAAVLVDAPEHRQLFDALFDAIWQAGLLEDALMDQAMPATGRTQQDGSQPATRSGAMGTADEGLELELALNQRLARALATLESPSSISTALASARTVQREGGWSREAQFRQADFRAMSVAEFEQASRLAAQLAQNLPERLTRRSRPAARGKPDLRASLRQSARRPLGIEIARRRPRTRPQPLVILCDVSGSMQRYTRLMLFWAHAITARDPRTETLALGTQLTRISRMLRHRDPDEALRATLAQIADWGGGTRLGTCLADFNRIWARRLLGARATVLLLTDGLDREAVQTLALEAQRLRRFARRVIWLNPLLRFDGFEPRAAGVRALLPAVDAMLPVHNLDSLARLASALR